MFRIQTLLILSSCSCCLIYTMHHIQPATANPSDKYHHRDGLHVPCTFFDTVNITDGVKLTNGSYLHEGLVIPPYLVGVYDYIYKDLVTRLDVEPHLRGCVCKLKPCINLCCPWGMANGKNDSACEKNDEHQFPEPLLNLTVGENQTETVNIFEHFAVQVFRPCSFMYLLQPELYPFDGWLLFENGSMKRLDDETYLHKNEYCMIPTAVNKSDKYYIINPANCDFNSEFSTMKVINTYAMLFSIPFMVLTIAVYLCIPELCNHHGKSLVCYLIGLIIGYSLLSTSSFKVVSDVNHWSCKTIGYTAYYAFMTAFFWLSVISFDLWHNFRGTRVVNRSEENKRFLIYSLYSWGLPVIFLLCTWYAQEYSNISEDYKPGIGSTYCWLNVTTWSAMIYFFGPVLLIIVANVAMFVMTAIKIHRVQRDMARIMAREDSTKNLRTEKDKFGLFLRLFIVMGVTWSLEVTSYLVGSEKAWSKIFYISDICNAMQGFLIFMLFVMKRKVKNLITNRYSSIHSSGSNSHQRQSQYSTKTTTSSVPNLNSATITTPTTTSPFEKPLMIQEQQRTSLRN